MNNDFGHEQRSTFDHLGYTRSRCAYPVQHFGRFWTSAKLFCSACAALSTIWAICKADLRGLRSTFDDFGHLQSHSGLPDSKSADLFRFQSNLHHKFCSGSQSEAPGDPASFGSRNPSQLHMHALKFEIRTKRLFLTRNSSETLKLQRKSCTVTYSKH